MVDLDARKEEIEEELFDQLKHELDKGVQGMGQEGRVLIFINWVIGQLATLNVALEQIMGGSEK